MTEIVECGRTIAGEIVAFDIQWDEDFDAADVAWAVHIRSHDGAEQVRLVHELVGGSSSQYVEGPTGRQHVDVDADLGTDEVTVRFPANVVGVAVDWPVWTAVLTIEGEDVSEQVIPPG